MIWRENENIKFHNCLKFCKKWKDIKWIDPWESGNKDEFFECPSSLNRENTHPAVQRWGNPGGVGEMELRIWEDQDGQSSWDSILERRGLHREKTLEICQGPPWGTAEYRSMHACEETTQEWGENIQKNKGIVPGTHTKLGIVTAPINQTGKTHNSWDIWVECSGMLCICSGE